MELDEFFINEVKKNLKKTAKFMSMGVYYVCYYTIYILMLLTMYIIKFVYELVIMISNKIETYYKKKKNLKSEHE